MLQATTSETISSENVSLKPEPPKRRLRSVCRGAEREEIARALQECQQNRTHSAVLLGISRRTLLNKIKQYELTPAACRALCGKPAPAAALATSTANAPS